MAKIDLSRLRKTLGMTQKELAKTLQLSQGFLSSVESGRNPFPDDRIDDLQRIFPDVNFDEYQLVAECEPETTIGSDNMFSNVNVNNPEFLKSMLDYITKQVKEEDGMMQGTSNQASEYQERLLKLSDELEKVRKNKYELLEENLKLKDLLRRNGIDYSEILESQ